MEFNGTISCLVSYLNNGKEYKRSGTFNFKARGQRKCWRLQEMECLNENCVNNIDVVFLR